VQPEYVYLLRVAVQLPSANIPIVLLPAAEPRFNAAVVAVAAATTQPEYVYLLVVVVVFPSAKMPTVLLPAAAPKREATVAAPPTETTHPEYVYLLRVVVGDAQTDPNANIPNVPSADGVTLLLNALIGDGP
jgi:hypothetical protein